jgi:hypothetical protein
VICREKGRARYEAARLLASRQYAWCHAFAIVSRIARCSLRLLARDLARVEIERRAGAAIRIGMAP